MTATTRPQTTEAVLDHHLAAFSAGEMADVLADYTEDSVIISNNGDFHGLDEIEQLFQGLFTEFGQEEVSVTLDEQRVHRDVAYITYHAETPDNVYEFVTDTFLIRNGKIATQTLGAVVSPK
ncbi:nuclear transport factor 2 family protein [Salinigranum salinum]|uniref:nuclear transport factor 2 family protein n=1 Tax=Salinigranum salinum TaxID=1364937 RepID=UPI001260643C|nr:nuclear transport factor 2 family protein [Salinigranum salinum]